MIRDFFKGKYNPSKAKGKNSLVSELWTRGLEEKRFPKIIEIEKVKADIRRYEGLIKGDEWKRRYRELIGEGMAPREAYDTVMEEMKGAEVALENAERVRQKLRKIEEQRAKEERIFRENQARMIRAEEERRRERQRLDEEREKRNREDEEAIQRAKDRLNFVGEEWNE